MSLIMEKIPLSPNVAHGESKNFSINISSVNEIWHVVVSMNESNYNVNPQTNKNISQTYQVQGTDEEKIELLQSIGIVNMFEIGE